VVLVLAAIPIGRGGYHAVFVFSLALAVLGLIVLALLVPDLRTADRKASSSDLSTRRRMTLRLSDLSQLRCTGSRGGWPAWLGDGWRWLHSTESRRCWISGGEVLPRCFS
jgi:hypothetical protein